MKLTVRKVDTRSQEVLATLAYLQKACLPYDVPYDVTKGHWWVAYADGITPIGFAGLVRSYSWWDCGYLCRAGVLAQYRGKGIQKRLVKVREAQAKKLGWNWLITDTRDNPPSANSLISCGFRMYDPTRPWGFKDALYWRKQITQKPLKQKKKAEPINIKEMLFKK